MTSGVPNKDSCTGYRVQDSRAGHRYRIPDPNNDQRSDQGSDQQSDQYKERSEYSRRSGTTTVGEAERLQCQKEEQSDYSRRSGATTVRIPKNEYRYTNSKFAHRGPNRGAGRRTTPPASKGQAAPRRGGAASGESGEFGGSDRPTRGTSH
jgi:hypothetical protein